MQRMLGMIATTPGRISRIAARSIGVAAISVLLLSLGSLTQPARATPPEVGACPVTGAVFVAALCGPGSAVASGDTTTYTYDFGSGTTTSTAYIPLLDPTAILAGTFKIDNSVTTPDIITGAAVATDWGSCTTCSGDKSAFADPAALIEVTLPSPGGTQTTVSFESNDPSVPGVILVGGIYKDPPLPTAAPEPATLALLGTALGGLGFCRWRRKKV